MANCTVHPIPLFQTKGDKSRMLYKFGYGQPLALTNYVWYIEGTKVKILVDAGGSIDFFSRVMGVRVEPIQPLDTGLSKLGIGFSDIDLIILTHLHTDHVAQACRFPRARFLIQRDELQSALKPPHPLVATSYVTEFFRELSFEVVSGDTRICEEVSVLSTPGHSPGGQSVAIKTSRGIVIISGLCSTRENFEPPPKIRGALEVIPPTPHTNVMDAYDSMVRIKKMADILVPLHDPEYPQERTIP